MDRLPPDVLECVMRASDQTTRLVCARVSSGMRSAAMTPGIWTTATLRTLGPEALAFVHSCRSTLTTLRVITDDHLLLPFLDAIDPPLPAVREVWIHWSTDAFPCTILKSIVRAFPAATDIDLEMHEATDISAIDVPAGLRLRRLRIVDSEECLKVNFEGAVDIDDLSVRAETVELWVEAWWDPLIHAPPMTELVVTMTGCDDEDCPYPGVVDILTMVVDDDWDVPEDWSVCADRIIFQIKGTTQMDISALTLHQLASRGTRSIAFVSAPTLSSENKMNIVFSDVPDFAHWTSLCATLKLEISLVDFCVAFV